MTIGERIKQRRKELKISANELAKKLGKNRATIYRYEKGEIENLPIDVLEPLADALQTTPQYLMGWKDENEDQNITAGNLIRALREHRRMRIEDFSKEIGISADELKKFELGQSSSIPVHAMNKMAEYYKVIPIEFPIEDGLENKTALISINEENAKLFVKWYDILGPVTFTEEEYDKLIEYAKFLLSQRT